LLYHTQVPDFGTVLETKIQTLQAMRTGQTQLLPTAFNTLLIEAGCSAEKTRKLIKWLKERLAIDPDMPALFVTTRQTHADDLAATLAWAKMVKTLEGMGFVNYRDGKVSAATSQKDYLAGGRRCIVSFEGIDSVDLELYRHGVVVMDEVRSLAAIPGGGTMEKAGQPSRTNPCVRALGMLCARAKYRVAMDADVSADGAVRDFLWSVAPQFDVLHVQLRQAALSRKAHYGFTESKRDTLIMKLRQRLALFRARYSRKKAMAGLEGQQLRKAALAVIHSWVKVKRRRAGEDPAELQLPFRDLGASVRDAPPSWKPVSIGMVRRQDGEAERDRLQSLRQLFQVHVAQMAMDAARKRFARLVERVFVIVGQRGQGSKVAAMANEIGAWTACEDDFYSGKGNDAVKRAHFKDTTRAWFWADVVIANSTLSVGVNVRIHFACCFLYTCASEQAPPLRVQLQGIVRVGRDEDDPLTDERIFVLIAGSAPTLDSDLVPQPQRHRRVLNELRAAAAEGRRAASAAKASGDERLDSPVQSVASESELSDKLLSLLAWSALEKADNCGRRHAIKLVELCKLPTRAWPRQLMEDMPDAECDELDAFEDNLKENAATARLKTEDGRVGAMSTAKQYEWKLDQLQQAAVAKGTSLDYQRGDFIAYQEGLRVSKGARQEKDARAHADEAIYNVVRHLTPFDWSGAAWPAVEDYAKVAHRIDAIVRRATLLHIPHDELVIIWEAQRRAGHAAHSEVVAPPHLMHKWLAEFASELGVSADQLLRPTTFRPEQHEWLQCHNRLRAKMGEAGLQQRDAERRLRLYDLAKKLGAKKVTKQMTIAKIVAAVLCDVLALTPPSPLNKDKACGPGEKKVPVEAAHGTFFQVAEAWEVEDEFDLLVPEIQLDMLDPERRTIRRVRAADWETTFEHLTNQACGDEELGGMLSDAEGEEEGDAGLNGDGVGGGGGDSGVALPHAPDPLLKSFQVDRARLRSVISECDHNAPAVAAAKAGIDARRNELHAASHGEGGGFSAAFVMLVHPTEPKVLMARECRDGYGTRRTGGGRRVPMREAFNPLGGKRKGEETGRQTAAREACEETAEHLSAAAKRGLCDGAPGVWAGDGTKSYVYVYRSPKGSDAGLHEKWRSVPETPTLMGVEWVPIEQLLDEAWCRQHCHDFSLEIIAAARPLLQQAATASGGAGPSGTHPDAAMHRQELKELDALHSHIARFEGFHSVARGFEMRCETGHTGPDGWVNLTDTYKETVGRRYVESHCLSRVESEKRWQGAPPRTATLQGGHSDTRTVCCGARAHDIDCENSDYRLICSLATQTGNVDLVPTAFDYVAHREAYIKEICELHDCSEGTAKRLANVVGNCGSYWTWLRNNALRVPSDGLAVFECKRCKAFLPQKQCDKNRGESNMTRELEALRTALFDHPRFRATVKAERGRLQRERLKPSRQHDASLWSTCVMQASENEVLGHIERALFRLGWDVWALIFDGLMAAPSAECTEPDVKKAMAAAEAACKECGWDIKLADKPLHGLQDETPKSIANALAAVETWACRMDAAGEET
jgi:8-oxo-dGTP pyrophosphatase MutT (NUDIX family)